MSLSNYAEEKVLQALFNNVTYAVATPYMSLHTADPGETGASEAAGGTYTRQLTDFNVASNPAGTVTNNGIVDFTLMPACTITHVGVWDAVAAGNFICSGAFASSKVVNAGDTYRVPDVSLTVTLS